MDATLLYDVGMALVFVGMAVSVIAAILLFVSSSGGKRKTRREGVIIIGFIPIVFGTDKDSIKKVLLLSLLLTTVLVVAIVLYNVFFR